MRILANDGIAKSGQEKLEANGFTVDTTTVAQNQLIEYLNQHKVAVLIVRSATQVTKEVIDGCPSLKIIARGGVGMDNIEVQYAKDKGLSVINTPAASSHSVAELVFAHLFSLSRFLHLSNREMPLEGDTKFKQLKKSFSKGVELRGKTLGIIGFGRIGQATAKIAYGLGMKVIAFDPHIENASLSIDFSDGQELTYEIKTQTKKEVLEQADFISLHIPAQKKYAISNDEIKLLKKGAFIINAARGGVLDEKALQFALQEGKLGGLALDVFENEPTPDIQLLMTPSISMSPHIGAATVEAQERIGEELADQIITILP